MRFVSFSYVSSNEFKEPVSWLKRIDPHLRVLEALAVHHEVHSIEQIDYEGKLEKNGVHYHFVGPRMQKFPISLHRLIKQIQPDVIIVHGLNFPLQVIQLRQYVGKRPKILLQAHADQLPSGWKKWAQKISDRFVNGYLFTSIEQARPWIVQKIFSSTGKIREAMVGASPFKPMKKEEAVLITGVKGNPALMFVGRLDANKDPTTLIKGFSIFSKLHPAARLYMVFTDPIPPEQLQQLINETGTKNQITLCGKIAHDELIYWYNSVDWMVSTSHSEAFGMSVSEAMSCGCVPILTSIPAFKKLTGAGQVGLMFEAGNPDDLANSLEKAAMKDLTKERNIVLEYYQSHLSATAIAQQLEKAALSL